jgi:xanthine dehydrogenase YagS FAD-binding subunit
MNAFQYASPTNLDEAVALLAPEPGAVEILAGGTDLLNAMKDGVQTPVKVVSLRNIADLRGIQADGNQARIGAMTTLSELIAHPALNEHFPALVTAARNIHSPQLRAMATLGGNLCQRPRCWYYRSGYGLLGQLDGKPLAPDGDNRYHAIFGGGPAYYVHPSSLAPALVALDAVATVRGANGQSRDVPLGEFYKVPQNENERETVLAPNELVTHVTVPVKGLKSATYEVKHRQCVEWPLAEAVVAFTLDGNTARDVRVVLGHVAPKPWPATKAAEALEGQAITPETAAKAGEAAADGASPLSQNAYKVQLVKVAVKRAALAAAGQPQEV